MKHETLVLAIHNYIDKIYNIPPSLNKSIEEWGENLIKNHIFATAVRSVYSALMRRFLATVAGISTTIRNSANFSKNYKLPCLVLNLARYWSKLLEPF